MVLINVIVPVIIVAGAGFMFARLTRFDVASLTKLTFYVLSPALIFNSMLNPAISATTLANVALFVVIVHSTLLLLAAIGVRWTDWDADTRTAAILSFSLNNCGNYGLPVLLFAFGEAGFTIGVVYMVVHLTYQILFGVGIASWRKGMSIRSLLRRIISVPWLYAVILAAVIRLTSFDLPAAIGRPVALLADAAIPVQLILLGMSLATARVGSLLRQAVPISLAKLVIPPLLAWGVTAALGFHGLLRAVMIIEASTPTAVNALILSLQYKRRSELSASVVLLTTIGGVGVTSLLLWLLA